MHQSADALAEPRRPSPRAVIVSVIGHLRDVKDPLRAAEAARLLPADSRVRIEQVGRAYTPRMGRRARAPRWRTIRAIAGATTCRPPACAGCWRAATPWSIISLSEGGANVISEAVVAGVPILASRMDGNVGLLGADYPGYFPVGDTRALARLLRRLEERAALCRACWARRSPARAAVSAGARDRGLAKTARGHQPPGFDGRRTSGWRSRAWMTSGNPTATGNSQSGIGGSSFQIGRLLAVVDVESGQQQDVGEAHAGDVEPDPSDPSPAPGGAPSVVATSASSPENEQVIDLAHRTTDRPVADTNTATRPQ